MLSTKRDRIIPLSNRVTSLLGICIFLFVWIDYTYYKIVPDNVGVLAENSSKELSSDLQIQKLCTPSFLPVELSIDLLNDPQSSGDVADFEFGITSLIEVDQISAYFVTPAGAQKVSGENWAGIMALYESRKLNAGIKIDTEEAITIRAVVEVTIDDNTFLFSKAYYLDLGEKEYASLEPLAITGFSGADSLNLIIPKSN